MQRSYTPAGLAAAMGTTAAWAAGIVLIKLTTVPFLVASFYRHAFSVPFLALALLATRERSLPWRTAGVGGLLFALHQVFHFSALRYSTAAVVTILFALQPVVVGAAGGRVTGERATVRFYLWSLVAIAGCSLLVLASARTPDATPLGTVLAVANLLAFSAYYLATKRARERVGTISWLFVMTLVSGAVIGGLALLANQDVSSPRGDQWLILAGIGIIPGTIGHLLITWAHPRIHAAASSAVILGVPVLASVGAAIFVGETFGPLHAAGGIVALFGAGAALRHLPPPATIEAAETYGEVAT